MSLSRIALALLVFALSACTASPPAEPPDTRQEDEAAIRAAAEEWAAAAEAKDADAFVSFYTDDAVLMVEDVPDVRGREALAEGIAGMMQDPSFALTFETDEVVVARSGDLASETGSYSLTLSGPDGEPVTDEGHYVVVWHKMPDGSWKAAIDAPVSDPTPAPEEE